MIPIEPIQSLKCKNSCDNEITPSSDTQEIPGIHGTSGELDARDKIGRDTDISRDPKSPQDNEYFQRNSDQSEKKFVAFHRLSQLIAIN